MAQLPYRNALYNQRICRDQLRHLRRRQEVQPHRGRDNAEGEAGKAGDERGRKCASGKQREIEGEEVAHCTPHHIRYTRRARGDRATLGLLQLRGGCRRPALICSGRLLGNQLVAQKFELVSALMLREVKNNTTRPGAWRLTAWKRRLARGR